MPVDQAVLKNELLTDPQNLGYAPLLAKGDHASIVKIMNNKVYPGTKQIDLIEVARYCDTYYITENCALYAANASNLEADKFFVRVFLRYLTGAHTYLTLDASIQEVKDVFNKLKTLSLLTNAQFNYIKNLVNISQSRAEILFGQDITISDMPKF